jgi:hypothetical protein
MAPGVVSSCSFQTLCQPGTEKAQKKHRHTIHTQYITEVLDSMKKVAKLICCAVLCYAVL